MKNITTRYDLTHQIALDLESHYAHIIRSILKKLIKNIGVEDAKNIYLVIIESFNRRGIFDEGLTALSALALSKIFILYF